MTRERTYRERLRAVHHTNVRAIAMHLARGQDPTAAQLKAVRDFYRAMFHVNRSSEALTDSELSDVIYEIEAHAASLGVTFPDRPQRDAARAPAAQPGARG